MTPARVLIVEDEPVIRELLSDFLESQDYEVVLASSAEEGLELFAQTPFQGVFIDYGLPRMNGIDACRRMHAARPECRLVLMTGWGSLEAAEREPAISTVLPKPFDLVAILNILQTLGLGSE